jgi:hypothetical protein
MWPLSKNFNLQVLIGENNIAKICDFGLARVIADDEYCPKQGSRFPGNLYLLENCQLIFTSTFIFLNS